ncbi:YbfB/YjiJ family MFS transporter [Cupriavidus basilensis]
MAGFGYIITATFLPVIARQAMPGSLWADLFWPIFGVGVIIGAFVASRVSTERDNHRLLAFTYAMQAIGVAIAVVWPTVARLRAQQHAGGACLSTRWCRSPCARHGGSGAQAQRLMGLMTASHGPRPDRRAAAGHGLGGAQRRLRGFAVLRGRGPAAGGRDLRLDEPDGVRPGRGVRAGQGRRGTP